MLSPFPETFQDAHSDKRNVHKAGEGRTARPALQTVIQGRQIMRSEERPCCQPPKELRKGTGGLRVRLGSPRRGEQEGERGEGPVLVSH